MKKLILVDGNSILFRAYYATAYSGAALMKTTKGEYTNALFAFINMFQKIVTNGEDNVLVAFDTGKPTIRHKYFEEYKAGRKPMPEELAQQIPLVHEYINLLGINTYSKAGYEADDIIGTLAKEASLSNIKVDIYSSDRDLLQLVDDNITVNLLRSGMKEVGSYTPKEVLEEMELSNHQIIDLMALMGDPSDNIPGVPGIGIKTATRLLKKYGTMDKLYEDVENIKGKMGENLREHKDKAILSKELVTILLDADIDYKVSDLIRNSHKQEDLVEFLQKYELHSLVRQLDIEEIVYEWDYIVIDSEDKLKNILKDKFAIHFEFDDANYHKANLWGIGLSNDKENYFIKSSLIHTKTFMDYIESKEIEKYTYNYKAAIVYLLWQGIKFNNATFDFLLAAYLIDSHYGKEEIKYIVSSFNYNDVEYDDVVYGKGAKKGLPEDETIYQKHIVSKARAIYLLKDTLKEKLTEAKQIDLLNDVEMPLSIVLASMEFEGLSVSLEELDNQTVALKNRIKEIEDKVKDLAGKDFNVASPKQVGEILFEDLALPHGKKNKTGYSTNAEILNKIKDEHEIVPLILDFRELNKLYTTYLAGLKNVVFDDNKVHTIYMQALTTTGRLSSIEPNLQNIPIRSAEGREIRKIFTAKENHQLLGADYSQIELRVLADMADVKGLQEAFNKGRDIHSETAKAVFELTTDTTVDENARRAAKAVNFGIIYGMGAWSLSDDIGVSQKEAQTFIDNYFKAFPEIKTYMDNIVEFAKENGYVETLINRRRYIPELKSSVYMQRQFGERTALNAPIQGTAADIIKIAMIDLYNYLEENEKKSKLILQVHDELILEVHNDELEEMKKIVPKIMNDAYQLKVKLRTDFGVGKTWFDIE